MVAKYNELVDLIDGELFSAESSIEDKSTLRTIMSDIKDTLFGNYGKLDDLNLFNFGFEVDKTGYLSVDTTEFNEAVENNIDDLRSLFVGVAEKEGMGTQLKEYVDSLDSFDGLLTKYQDNMTTRKDFLEDEQEKAQEDLDNKYALLAQQFASYGAIITQFENQFSGLKLMIEQSTA
jgi:flagellar hook-associated protein 2